ncbi:MAG TPA: hypothetical protein VIS73_08085 [Rhodocyclaceae bacterium]
MKRQRRALLRFAGASLIGLGGALGAVQRLLAAGLEPVAPGVHRVKGAARINGRPAEPGMPVGPGDTVDTDAGAEIIYVIGKDAYLQREKSSVSFAGEAAVDALRVITGKLLSVFGKGEKRITTPTATIGVRGTGCYIEAETASTYFCLCYGEVEVMPTATPNAVHRYRTSYHDKPYEIGDTVQAAMKPAHVINHTDVELTLLESLCGRRPPFFGRDSYY